MIIKYNTHHSSSGDLVVPGGGLRTVPSVLPREADAGAAGRHDPPAQEARALHPQAAVAGEKKLVRLSTFIRYRRTGILWSTFEEKASAQT